MLSALCFMNLAYGHEKQNNCFRKDRLEKKIKDKANDNVLPLSCVSKEKSDMIAESQSETPEIPHNNPDLNLLRCTFYLLIQNYVSYKKTKLFSSSITSHVLSNILYD